MSEKAPPQNQEQKPVHLEQSPLKAKTLAEQPPQATRNFETEIQDVETRMRNELEGLNAAREKLGMPPDDNSVALAHLREKHAGLVAERDKTQDVKTLPDQKEDEPPSLQENSKEQEDARALNFRLEKDLTQIGDDISRFGITLQRRENDRLTPLLDTREVSSMLASARSLGDSVRLGRVDFEQLSTALRGVSRGLENFGQYRSAGGVHEDADNLKRLANSARSAAEELYRTQKTLTRSEEKGAAEAASAAGRLASNMEKIWATTARRLDLLSQYEGR